MEKSEDFSKLEEIYEDLINDRKNLESQILENKDCIKENELFIESLINKEEADYKMFSPRNALSQYKDVIHNKNIENEKYKNSISKLNQHLEVLNYRINLLSELLEKKNHDNEDNFEQSVDDISYIMLDIKEKERQRIARDLHDNTVQNLTHLIHKIELSSRFIDQDIVRAKMELVDISRSIKSIINDMRDIIFNLRPMEFDDIGLRETLEKYLTEMKFQSGIQIEYDIDCINVNNQLAGISLYDIVKECVNNAIKYSKAECINVSIKNQTDSITIIIEDNGIGFDVDKKIDNHHFGLMIIKENISILKGNITIHSICGKGTKIEMNIPRSVLGGY